MMSLMLELSLSLMRFFNTSKPKPITQPWPESDTFEEGLKKAIKQQEMIREAFFHNYYHQNYYGQGSVPHKYYGQSSVLHMTSHNTDSIEQTRIRPGVYI